MPNDLKKLSSRFAQISSLILIPISTTLSESAASREGGKTFDTPAILNCKFDREPGENKSVACYNIACYVGSLIFLVRARHCDIFLLYETFLKYYFDIIRYG